MSQDVRLIKGDLRNLNDLAEIPKVDFVFHLAVQPLVRESYISPKETCDINIGGTVNILECCRLSNSVKVIVNVTSDKCYENMESVWGYRESDTMGGFDPYSSSKAALNL